jgi:Ca-activated chloride channel homolog
MSFRAPNWLWLLAIAPLIVAFLVMRERQRVQWARRFASERIRGLANPLRAARPWVLGVAIAALSVAMAGPYGGFTTIAVSGTESNRIIAVDVSNSMSAEDVGTSRLAAAKAVAKRLIENHHGRVGLVVFESGAEVVSPLTNDSDALLALLETIQAGEVGIAGSDIGSAVMAALRLTEGDATQRADIVIISDGEEQGRRLADAMRAAKRRGIRVSGITIGTANGSTIPAGDGVLRDNGEIVTTYARHETMERVARATGGIALENPFSEHSLDMLMARRTAGARTRSEVRVPVDRYQWPLAFAFIALFGASLLHRGAE